MATERIFMVLLAHRYCESVVGMLTRLRSRRRGSITGMDKKHFCLLFTRPVKLIHDDRREREQFFPLRERQWGMKLSLISLASKLRMRKVVTDIKASRREVVPVIALVPKLGICKVVTDIFLVPKLIMRGVTCNYVK
jgi:hypothetical protein